MAWTTTLGPDMARVEYRLREQAGCDRDAQMDYRMSAADAPLRWVGEGLAEFGIQPGSDFAPGDDEAARLLADGRDPTNKDLLVDPQRRVHPRAKLLAGPFADAIEAAAAERGITVDELLADRPRQAARYARLERGITKQGADAHRVAIRDLEKLARAAGVDLDAVYDAEALKVAREHADRMVRTGNRGYDLTLNVPKSFSVLYGLADPELAGELRAAYDQAVDEAVEAMNAWAGYGQRGHQGDGQLIDRIDGTGLLGWSMTHHTARPVGGHVGDPHLHAHVVITNMVKGVDGQWSTVGAGGRDIMRHVPAVGAFTRARLREITTERFGATWSRDPRTGEWEIDGVSADLRARFSKRQGQVRKSLRNAESATPAQERAAAEASRSPKKDRTVTDLRADWRDQAEAAGYDVDALVAQAAPGRRDIEPADIDVAELSAKVFDPSSGVTAHRKSVSRADVLTAVADHLPTLTSRTQLEALTEQVLDQGLTARLGRNAGGPHLTHADRYTSIDVVDAEAAILTAARDRIGAGYAAVTPRDAAAAIAAFEDNAGFELSAEQQAVVTRLATSGNGIEAVIGAAGTGKTTIMQALRTAHEAAGHRVAGASTAAVAAHHLEAETGIPSTTVASWLHRIDRGEGLDGVDVLIAEEAAMWDDRQLARIVAAAAESGTQIVGIGDPQQLRSPGVGSTFGDVHAAVGGLELTEVRRQRDETHRAALASWRDGGRRATLDRLSAAGVIHAEDSIEATHAAMIGAWDATRRRWRDSHDAIDNHLMLAGTNSDVRALNDAAQAVLLDAGELDPATARDYRLPDGQVLTLCVGDQIMTRLNDRRPKRPGPDVLNGYRGVVRSIDERTGAVEMEWRDRDQARSQRLTGAYVRGGHVQLGYAMTVHLAQGQTAETVQVNLTGLSPDAAYPALSRHKGKLDAWIARDVVEDDTTRARLGEPADAAERLRRAIDAYATHLERPDPEELVIAELGDRYEHLLDHRDEPGPDTDREPRPGRDARTERPRRTPWWERRYGHLTPGELDRQIDKASQRLAAAERALAEWQKREAVRQQQRDIRVAAAERGDGQAVKDLEARRQWLTIAAATHDEAVQARAEAADLDRQLAGLERQIDTTRERAGRGAIRLWLDGTSREQQLIDARRLEAEHDRLTDRRAELQHQGQAGGHDSVMARKTGLNDLADARPALQELVDDWDNRRNAAIATDRTAAEKTSTTQAAFPDREPAVAWHRRERDALVAEAELRDEQPEKIAKIERRDRAVARAEAADRINRDDDRPPRSPREAAATDAERAAQTRARVEAAHDAAIRAAARIQQQRQAQADRDADHRRRIDAQREVERRDHGIEM